MHYRQTEIGEVSVRKRRSRQEIKRQVTEFETSGLRRSEFCHKHSIVDKLAAYIDQKKGGAPFPPCVIAIVIDGAIGKASNWSVPKYEETMKTRLVLALVGLVFSFALPTFAQEKNTVDPQARQQIEAVFMQFQEAYNKRDAAAIGALHTQDAVEVRSWAGLASGRQAIERRFAFDLASGSGKMVNELVQVYASGRVPAPVT